MLEMNVYSDNLINLSAISPKIYTESVAGRLQ